jgi:rhodanese-related sulfurtransferase
MRARTVRIAALIWLIALLPATLSALLHPRRPAWRASALAQGEVDLAQVRAWPEPPLWIDARSRTAFEQEHIPGALLLNEDEWDGLFERVLAAWRPPMRIVVYCDSRECQASKHVAERLRGDFAMPDVFVLHGGWSTWKNGGT